MSAISQFISWLFMPLLMPIYALLIVMYVPSDHYFYNPFCMYLLPQESKTAILYMFILFGVAAPGLSFYLLQRSNIIQSIEMDNRKERSIPIVVMFLYCLMLYVMFVYKSGHSSIIPKYIYALPLSGVFVTFIFFFINRWKKISIHAASSGILVGFIFAYMIEHSDYHLWILSLAFIISGLVMSARLYLEKHTLQELIIGWGIGSFVTFAVNFYY